jgi:hypothetical protein
MINNGEIVPKIPNNKKQRNILVSHGIHSPRLDALATIKQACLLSANTDNPPIGAEFQGLPDMMPLHRLPAGQGPVLPKTPA